MDSNVWVCGACRSINQPREPRCYKCRTPRELAKVDPETLVVAGVGSAQPAVDPKAVVGTYRSSSDRAFAAQVLIVLTVFVTAASKIVGADVVSRLIDGDVEGANASQTLLLLLGGAGFASAVVAVAAWSAWLSRLVDNIPALGLGWPNVTPSAAFIESFLPGVNLFRVPAIVRDVMNRLEGGPRGDALIAAAWLGLVGGVVVPRFARYIAGPLTLESQDAAATLGLLAGQVGLGLTIVGATFLIVLIRQVEGLADGRARAETAPAVAPPPPVPEMAVPEGISQTPAERNLGNRP
jgi:hypothetical protein